MGDPGPVEPPPLGRAQLPPPFERRVLTLAPGAERAAGAGRWPDALVVVARGEVELVYRGGSRGRFGRGTLVWLTEVGPCTLRNPGSEPAILIAVSRGDDFSGPPASH